MPSLAVTRNAKYVAFREPSYGAICIGIACPIAAHFQTLRMSRDGQQHLLASSIENHLRMYIRI